MIPPAFKAWAVVFLHTFFWGGGGGAEEILMDTSKNVRCRYDKVESHIIEVYIEM